MESGIIGRRIVLCISAEGAPWLYWLAPHPSHSTRTYVGWLQNFRSRNFAKFPVLRYSRKISHNTKLKISRKYENENFAATLLLHNLPSATHPPLPSARRFFNVARQCFFDMKTNKEPYFSILSSFNSVVSHFKFFFITAALSFLKATFKYHP